MKRILILGSLALLLAHQSGVAQTATVSLEQTLHDAAVHSARLRASAEQIAAQRAAVRETTASRWPTLSASGSYAYTSEVPELELALPIPIPGFPPIRKELGDGNVYDFALTARAPLFAGGSLRERSRAEQSALLATEHDLAADSLRLAYDVRRAYFSALSAAKRQATAQQALHRLERHLDELRKAKTVGMASDEMIIQTESRLKQTESALIAAEAEARATRLLLGSFVGKAGEEMFPADELELSLITSEFDLALETRNEIRALNSRISQTQHLTRAAQGSFLPTLAAQAAYHYAKPGVNQFENEWMDYATVGVNLTWTLWDWNSRSSQVAKARAGVRTLEARKQELTDALATRLATAQQNVDAAQAALAKATERLELEQRRFRMIEGRYRVGAGSESEFLDAQDDLTNAQLDRDGAAARLRLAEAEWLNAAGK